MAQAPGRHHAGTALSAGGSEAHAETKPEARGGSERSAANEAAQHGAGPLFQPSRSCHSDTEAKEINSDERCKSNVLGGFIRGRTLTCPPSFSLCLHVGFAATSAQCWSSMMPARWLSHWEAVTAIGKQQRSTELSSAKAPCVAPSFVAEHNHAPRASAFSSTRLALAPALNAVPA